MFRSSYFILIFLIIYIFSVGMFSHSANPILEKLSPKHTGIHFSNEIKDNKTDNIMIYSNFYGGAGVGVIDINNDGLQDLFFAGNQTADKLYLNQGNLSFKDISDQAGILDDGGWSSGVLVGDVNGDQLLDIYITRELYDDDPDLRKNKLYLNNGDLTFTEKSQEFGVDDNQRTRHGCFLDYDKDGDLDIFLCNQPPNPGDYSKYYNTELLLPEYSMKLYANEGNKFVDVTSKAGLFKTGFPNSVSASDLNNDGWVDLFVSNDFWVEDWIFINNGDGTFTEKIHELANHISFSSMGVDAGDINNDGLLDIMVLDMVAEDNYRLKANMSGMDPAAFWHVVNTGGHHQYMFNMLHLNNGAGNLSDIAQLANVASTDWSWSVLMADLDNDGWKDIFVTNGLMRDIRNKDASKKFPDYLEKSLYEYLQKNPNPDSLGIWDIVDIEKALELVPSEKLANYVFKNNGDLTFSKKVEEWGIEEKTFSNGSAYADLDNDGDLDLIINNINDPASIYKNNTIENNLGNYLRIKLSSTQQDMNLFGTKIWITTGNAKQFFEITGSRGMYSCSEPDAHFGLGKETLVDEIKIQWPNDKISILKEVQANQTISVDYQKSNPVNRVIDEPIAAMLSVVSDTSILRYNHTENEFDDYKMQVLMPHKMSTQGPHLTKGDINNDGLEDLFIGGAVKEPDQLFVQNELGEFKPLVVPAFEADKTFESLGSVFFDVEGDGDLDLYVVSGGNEFNPSSKYYQDRLYLNHGDGQFEKSTDRIPQIITSGSKVRATDYDHDGDVDLIIGGRHKPWSYPEASVTVLLENEDGILSDKTQELAPDLLNVGMINDIKWIDYNGDGWQDLLLAGEWTPIVILENLQGKFIRLETNGLENSTGWWFSLEAADIDGDGDQDFVAGNLGLNYKYKASPNEPFEVYYYDFDKNSSKDVVLTYYNYGIKYPLRGKQCSSEQVPMLNTKFKTYDLFASSDVFEIYGEESLENALHFEAKTFASSYIENLGSGRFSMHELPIQAQLSSINDVLINDYNRDGFMDLLIAGNLYNAEVETTRNDAGYGLILLGDGAGAFDPLSRFESGLFIPENVKSMLEIKTEKSEYILIGINDEPMKVYSRNFSNVE